jgi:cytochrome c-type biogenesis protein CcmE
MRIRPRFLIGGALIVAAVAYLIAMGISSTAEYYLTVNEAASRQAELHNQLIRIAGRVQPGTINWNPGTLTLVFAIAPPPPQDGVKFERVSIHPEPVINVVCNGQPKPDMFAPGRDVIVEGRLTSRNFVDADQVLTSCPSKYRAKKAT